MQVAHGLLSDEPAFSISVGVAHRISMDGCATLPV